MLAQEDCAPAHSAAMKLRAAAELQDDLRVAGNELDRLQRLLSDAGDSLLSHFRGASSELRTVLDDGAVQPPADQPQLHKAMAHMTSAITAMQFQDMAAQLVAHTTRRLRNCADRLAGEAVGDDEDGAVQTPPCRPNPVTQDEMHAGSVELF